MPNKYWDMLPEERKQSLLKSKDWFENKNYTCPECGSIYVGSSPTGDWCNVCGWEYPCPCDAGEHKQCLERRRRYDPTRNSCCCGEYMEE